MTAMTMGSGVDAPCSLDESPAAYRLTEKKVAIYSAARATIVRRMRARTKAAMLKTDDTARPIQKRPESGPSAMSPFSRNAMPRKKSSWRMLDTRKAARQRSPSGFMIFTAP